MQGNFENFCLGAVDIAKHLFGSHISEKTDDGFHFACSHQGVFFFYLGMWSRTAFFQGAIITQCLSASWAIFWNWQHYLTAVINCINAYIRASLWKPIRSSPLFRHRTSNCCFNILCIFTCSEAVKTKLQQVKWRWQFCTSGNAGRLDNKHILSSS